MERNEDEEDKMEIDKHSSDDKNEDRIRNIKIADPDLLKNKQLFMTYNPYTVINMLLLHRYLGP